MNAADFRADAVWEKQIWLLAFVCGLLHHVRGVNGVANQHVVIPYSAQVLQQLRQVVEQLRQLLPLVPQLQLQLVQLQRQV